MNKTTKFQNGIVVSWSQYIHNKDGLDSFKRPVIQILTEKLTRCAKIFTLAVTLIIAAPQLVLAQSLSFSVDNVQVNSNWFFGFEYVVGLHDVASEDREDYVAYVNGVEGDGWSENCAFGCVQTIETGAIFGNLDVVKLSAVAQLVHEPTGEVIDRKKITFTNPRKQLTIAGFADYTMGMQVTDTGLDEFSELLMEILPPDDFEDQVVTLGNNNRTIEGGSDPLACFDLTELDPGFVNIPGVKGDFNTAVGLATFSYGAFQTAVAAGGSIAGAPFCVKKLLTHLHSNWEVCVRRLDSDVVDVEIDGLVSASLLAHDGETPGGPTQDGLSLYADFGAMDLEMDVTLADLFFRWKPKPGICEIRPQRDITSNDPEFDAWASCPGVEMSISSPSAEVDGYEMNFVQTTSLEGVAVDGANTVDINMTGSVERTKTRVNQCAHAAINPFVQDVVLDHLNGFEQSLEAAWLAGSDSAAARATNDILIPLGVGERDVDISTMLTWHADKAEVDSYSEPFRVDGFRAGYGPTQALLRPEYKEGGAVPPWIFIPETPIVYSLDGLTTGDAGRQPFDVGFTISTNNLNQILLERVQTDLLNFTVQIPASGASANGEVTPASTMTQEPLELRVSPTQQPFVWLTPDESEIDVPHLVYQSMRLVAQLVRPGEAGADDELVAFMELDFAAPDVVLSMSQTGSEFLDVDLGDTYVNLNVLEVNSPNCPMHPPTSGWTTSCEGIVSQLFEAVIEPSLVDIMAELLSEVPGPGDFDAAGATSPCALTDRGHDYNGQRISIYADLTC